VRSFIAPEAPWLDCHIVRTTSVRAEPRPNPRRSQQATAELNPLAVGALMLTTDVVADHATWRVVQMPSFGSRGIALVETEYPWGTHVARFVWPTPDWPAFIDHSVLVAAWASMDANYLMELSLVELSYCMAWVVARVANHRAELAVMFAEKSAEKPAPNQAKKHSTEGSGRPSMAEIAIKPPAKNQLYDQLFDELKELATRLDNEILPAQIDATRNSASRRWLDALALFYFEEYVGARAVADAGNGGNGWRDLLGKIDRTQRGMPVESLRVQLAQRALTKPDYRPTATEADSMLREIEKRASESGSPPPKTS